MPDSSKIVNAVKSFRDSVYAMLGRNISGRDADLWARASMVPWHFPDVPEFNGDKHIMLPVKYPTADEQGLIVNSVISI